jgi:hypothetical protein
VSRRLPWILALSAPLAAVILIAAAEVISIREENRERVAWMLNIAKPPPSLRVSDCESGAITDVVIVCGVEIDSAEFSLLLEGYAFASEFSGGKSSALGLGVPEVAPEFDVATTYTVIPPSFKDGGSVQVFVDAEKRRAIVDYYKE